MGSRKPISQLSLHDRALYEVASARSEQLSEEERLIELQVLIHDAFHQNPRVAVRCVVAALDGCMDEADELLSKLDAVVASGKREDVGLN